MWALLRGYGGLHAVLVAPRFTFRLVSRKVHTLYVTGDLIFQED